MYRNKVTQLEQERQTLMGTHQDHIFELNQQIKLLQSTVSDLKEQNDKQCLNYQDQFRTKNEEITTLKNEMRKKDEYLKTVKDAAIKKVDQLTSKLEEQTKKFNKKLETHQKEIKGYQLRIKDLVQKIKQLETELTERAELNATKFMQLRGLQQLEGELNAKREQIKQLELKQN